MPNFTLPELNYYSIPELASRWKCDESKILDLYRSGSLDIGIYLDHVAATNEHANTLKNEDDCRRANKLLPVEKLNILLNGMHILDPYDLPRVYDYNTGYEIFKAYSVNQDINDDGIIIGGRYSPFIFKSPFKALRSQLRVLKGEVMRIENNISESSQLPQLSTAQIILSSVKETGLLRLIGALSICLGAKDKKLVINSEINASQIHVAISKVVKNLNTSNNSLGSSTIGALIPKAIQALKDDKHLITQGSKEL